MSNRIAASLALLVFAACLLEGGLRAGNSFTTTIGRALVAMGGTWVIGLALGWAAGRMIEENLKSHEDQLRKTAALAAAAEAIEAANAANNGSNANARSDNREKQ